MKGSQLNSIVKDAELRRVAAEFIEKFENDPYQPGLVHPEIYPDDLQEVIEDIFWLRGYDSAEIRVTKNPDGTSIKLEVLKRVRINKINLEDEES